MKKGDHHVLVRRAVSFPPKVLSKRKVAERCGEWGERTRFTLHQKIVNLGNLSKVWGGGGGGGGTKTFLKLNNKGFGGGYHIGWIEGGILKRTWGGNVRGLGVERGGGKVNQNIKAPGGGNVRRESASTGI